MPLPRRVIKNPVFQQRRGNRRAAKMIQPFGLATDCNKKPRLVTNVRKRNVTKIFAKNVDKIKYLKVLKKTKSESASE